VSADKLTTEKLAIEGGPQAVGSLGPFPAKIGKEELLEILDMWEFSPENKAKLKEIIEQQTNLRGPHLFRPKACRSVVYTTLKSMTGIYTCSGNISLTKKQCPKMDCPGGVRFLLKNYLNIHARCVLGPWICYPKL